MNIPLQAIAFTNRTIDGQHCPMPETPYLYTVRPEDQICFQLSASCEDFTDTIVNGSFETFGEEEQPIANWTIDVDSPEDTNIIRTNESAQCDDYSAKWVINSPSPATLTQTVSPAFIQGRTYKLAFNSYCLVGSSYTIAGILLVTVGGETFPVTPSIGAFGEFEIVFTFTSAPTGNDIVFALDDTVAEGVSAVYLDCVSLGVYSECCVFDSINNGTFTNGQETGGDTPLVSFDQWVGVGGTVLSESSGRDGTGRSLVLTATTDEVRQDNVFLSGKRYTIVFWAIATNEGDQLIVKGDTTPLETFNLTEQWVRYELSFQNNTYTDLAFESNAPDPIYIDDVAAYADLGVPFYIESLNQEPVVTIPVDPASVIPFEGGENVCIDLSAYENLPACFKICFDDCGLNLVLNFNFENHSGNDFADWSENQPSRTNLLLRSQEFENTSWLDLVSGSGVAPVRTANNVLAPDGTLTADRLVFNSGAGTGSGDYSELRQNLTTTGGNSYTGSLWLRGNVGGEQIVFRHVGGGSYDLITLTTAWQRFDKTEFSANEYFEFGIRQSVQGTINSTATVYAWGAQMEAGTLTTPYIPTTSATVTTSTGEILANTTVLGTTALLWHSGGGAGLSQTITLEALTQYKVRVTAKNTDTALYTGGQANLTVVLDGDSLSAELEDYFQVYEFNFTTDGTPDNTLQILNEALNEYGFAEVNDVQLFKTSELSTICSEGFNYTDAPAECLKELVWYDRENAYGVNYDSGFKNRLNLICSLQNPTYNRETFEKEENGLETQVNAYKVWKAWDLAVALPGVPEYVWDSLAHMAGHSNIELDGQPLAINEDSTLSIQFLPDTATWAGTVSLSPEGMYIIERTKNCP